MRATAPTMIRARLVLGCAALLASATACSGGDGSDAKRCETDVVTYYTQENLRRDGYRDDEIRGILEDPQVKSNKWAECMTGKGWNCTAVGLIECSTEADGPVASPFT